MSKDTFLTSYNANAKQPTNNSPTNAATMIVHRGIVVVMTTIVESTLKENL